MDEIIQQPVSRCTEFTLNGTHRTFLTNAASLACHVDATATIWNDAIEEGDTVVIHIGNGETPLPKGFTAFVSEVGVSPIMGRGYFNLTQRNNSDDLAIVVPVKIQVTVYKPKMVGEKYEGWHD